MAPALPDTSTLTTSSAIFTSSLSLPQIRNLHQQLYADSEDKAARLRSQVGGSYRELLGTADAIVRMQSNNHDVQALLSGMSTRCGRGVVGTKVSGLSIFAKEREGRVPELGEKRRRRGRDIESESSESSKNWGNGGPVPVVGLREVARATLLENCAVVVERLLKMGRREGGDGRGGRGERLLLAARVLLLGRLLVPSLAQAMFDEEIAASVESNKKVLTRLRQKLLRAIDRQLERAETPKSDPGAPSSCGFANPDVLPTLAAYSLSTSSSAGDVLRNLLYVRGEAISRAFDEFAEKRGDDFSDNVLDAMAAYTTTLLQVHDIVPAALADTLLALKQQRVLSTPAVAQIETLRLDVYQQWCGEEIEFFSPFIQHDDLNEEKARAAVDAWSEKCDQVLLDGIKTALGRMHEFKAIVNLRTRILKHWIALGSRARGEAAPVVQESLRTTLIDRLIALVDAKVRKLHLVGSEIASALQTFDPTTATHPSLWDPTPITALDPTDTLAGPAAVSLLRGVIAAAYGRGDAVSRAISAYASWRGVAGDVRAVVGDLEKLRWENDDEGADEIEDEDVIAERDRKLSAEDPARLRDRLEAGLVDAFAELERTMGTLWRAEEEDAKGADRAGRVAMYLLRVLRDIRSDLPDLKALRTFGMDLISPMQEKVVQVVVASSVQAYSVGPLARRTVLLQPLWEGEPALPVQPSPGTFIFLRDLSSDMSDAGTDLWSPQALAIAKRVVTRQLTDAWKEAIEECTRKQALEVHYSDDGKDGKDASADNSEATETKRLPEEEDISAEGSTGSAEGGNGGSEEKVNEKENGKVPEPEVLSEKAETKNPSGGGGGGSNNTSDKAMQDLFVQWLFDITFLQHYLGKANNNIASLRETIAKQCELDEACSQRVVDSVLTYYKKTTLLFGLLVGNIDSST